MKKLVRTSVFFLLGTITAFAQGDLDAGNAAITQATTSVTNMYDIIETLIFAIAAIIALVGAIKIFLAWNSGERDIQKMIIGWFGSCIFLAACGAIIGAFFGTGA